MIKFNLQPGIIQILFLNLTWGGTTEMIANIFRISQTKEKLKKDNASTADEANDKM